MFTINAFIRNFGFFFQRQGLSLLHSLSSLILLSNLAGIPLTPSFFLKTQLGLLLVKLGYPLIIFFIIANSVFLYVYIQCYLLFGRVHPQKLTMCSYSRNIGSGYSGAVCLFYFIFLIFSNQLSLSAITI